MEMIPTTLSLVVVAALIHAFWNILLKRVQGGLSFAWFVDILQSLVFAPSIAWVIYTERPVLGFIEWFCIGGSATIHIAYYFFLQRGYRLGDISLSVVHLSPVLLDLLANPVQALLLTPIVWHQQNDVAKYWARNRAELLGVTLLNPMSYILILSAMTIAPVSQIAPMREISTLIGAFIGGRLFAEEHLRRRLAAASVIVMGVVAVAHG
jgi:drug/metabolite transporter (DMT)-like permease